MTKSHSWRGDDKRQTTLTSEKKVRKWSDLRDDLRDSLRKKNEQHQQNKRVTFDLRQLHRQRVFDNESSSSTRREQRATRVGNLMYYFLLYVLFFVFHYEGMDDFLFHHAFYSSGFFDSLTFLSFIKWWWVTFFLLFFGVWWGSFCRNTSYSVRGDNILFFLQDVTMLESIFGSRGCRGFSLHQQAPSEMRAQAIRTGVRVWSSDRVLGVWWSHRFPSLNPFRMILVQRSTSRRLQLQQQQQQPAISGCSPVVVEQWTMWWNKGIAVRVAHTCSRGLGIFIERECNSTVTSGVLSFWGLHWCTKKHWSAHFFPLFRVKTKRGRFDLEAEGLCGGAVLQ